MDERITIRYESASAVLKQIEAETYELTRVYATKRQQGHGTELMKTVEKFADNNGLYLSLTVRPYRAVAGNILDRYQLVRFYKKFGFVEVGTHHDPSMLRLPTIAICDSCGKRLTKNDKVFNVGDSFDVILLCEGCGKKTENEIKEKTLTDGTTQHRPATMVLRINNMAGKMIGYLDIDAANIPSQEMLPVFKSELLALVKQRLGTDVTIEFVDRELEKFGLRQDPEGNLESV